MTRIAKHRAPQPVSASPPPVSPPHAVWLNRLLAATALFSAWLLFQLQPMVAKRILPWFGGGPAIWTTAMLFFQAGLLAGYLYAHLATTLLSPRRQVALHVGLLVAAVALVIATPIVPDDIWKPADSSRPAWRILAMLAACVGLPYLTLSATAPLTQVWFARANPGVTPYRLYALSNLGSLAALVSYPLLVEPRLGVVHQGIVWTILFGAFALMCGASGAMSLRVAGEAATNPRQEPEGSDSRPQPIHRFLWLTLPACAVVMLLAVTTHLCQDITSIPLLWIAPMVIYLLTFILTFESDRWYIRWLWYGVTAFSSFVCIWTWHYNDDTPWVWQIAAHLTLLFGVGMVCHGELARLRPPANRLTGYYLSISAGGALGGLFVSLVAPVAFVDYYELQAGMLATWVLALAVLITDPQSIFYDGRAFARLLALAALLLALMIGLGNYIVGKREFAIAMARNFYGTLKIRELAVENPQLHYYKLTNGRISHGLQYRNPAFRRTATQYYAAGSGVGMVLLENAPTRHVGVVGLGVGTLAAYANFGDKYTFYDINPQVIDFADTHFTFLQDARDRGATVEVIPGDARLSLERQQPQNFDVLALDAFSSDSIPAHLLTMEAFEIYLHHLRDPGGVLAVHVSNRYLNLGNVVRAAAERFKLDARLVESTNDDPLTGSYSVWVILTRRGAPPRPLGIPLDDSYRGRKPVVWTDDYNNLLDVFINR